MLIIQVLQSSKCKRPSYIAGPTVGLLEVMKRLGMREEDVKRIIYRLGSSLLSEHEKLFDRY